MTSRRTWAIRAAFTASLVVGSAAVAQAPVQLPIEASVARGARLYENWATESTAREQVFPNPAFTTKDVRVEPADTWRCVTCHGWDYKGSNGFPSIRERHK